MAGQPGATYVNEGPGQQINAGSVGGIYYIHRHVRESVEAYALTEDEIKRLRAIYVRTPAADRMIEILQAHNAIALIGPRGRGRRITSVAVIDELRAGVAGGIGRMVRRTMYRWATRATTDRSIQVTVAAVCGGPFGVSFPRNAMTRLRHLALHGEAEVQQRVIEAVQSLAVQPHLCDFILREVVRWMTEPGQPRVTGVRAFLQLSSEMAADVLPRTPSDFSRIGLLAAGLRASLHDPEHTEPTREVCSQWLESTARGKVPSAVVTNVIAGTCHDSYDIGLLIPVVWRWAKAMDSQPSTSPGDRRGTDTETDRPRPAGARRFRRNGVPGG